MRRKTYSAIALGAILAAPTAVLAQDEEPIGEPAEPLPEATEPLPEPTEPIDDPGTPFIQRGAGTEHLRTPMGVAVQLGGGVSNFISEETRDRTNVGGHWDVRVTVGTRSLVGLDLAYVGSAYDIHFGDQGLDPDAAIVGNGAEGALRLQAPLSLGTGYLLQPYAFGGLGWVRYDVVNADFNTSPVAEDDNVLTVPLGAGVGFGYRGFIADARFTYRPVFDDDRLFPAGEDFADLQTWNVGLTLGYEF